ncbi:MAG: hypothetical protein VW516_00210 [Rhodospirillaceae bacterium]|jgi:hypothetical protein
MQTTTSAVPYRTRAAFLVSGAWRWIAWTHADGNKHAAITDKAQELGATSWDFGQADHSELARWNFDTRG